ncbi:MAG: NADH:flavin oxidoreductase [Promethearchaeota archaeon]|nr:MAG: NADH:flavin oxidoreductase [Candidatus Lokiarchaeota archaeon]
MNLEKLFSPRKIGNVEIKNRILRSATFTNTGTKQGTPGEKAIEFYSELAKGGTGLIITGITSIDQVGRNASGQFCLDGDSLIADHKKFVQKIHDLGAKIAPQLSHAGRQSFNPKFDPVAPSPVFNAMSKKTPRELTVEQIEEIITNFAEATRRAYESGYDMVQFNAAHGWLLCNFLSPYTNKRNDAYGGNTEKRTKILVDICNQARDKVGKDFPLFLKLQTKDYFPEGISLDEGKEITKIAIDTGYDALEISGGSVELIIKKLDPYPSLPVKSPEQENYFLPNIKELKPVLKDIPIILMGGVRNPESAEKILQDNDADFIALCRPLIHEPGLPNRWKNGDLSPPLCVSCNQCFTTIMSGSLHCVVKKKEEKRKAREAKRKAQQ